MRLSALTLMTCCCFRVDLHVMFSLFDQDGDGYITTRELKEVMGTLGFNVRSKEAQKIFRIVDMDSM